MEKKLITIKEVTLNNNCPECYSTEGLKLTFKQKFVETPFYKSVTNDVVETLECTKCETTIYPVRWTEDIERVYSYQKKAFEPKKASMKLKQLAWIVFITIDVIAVLLVLYFAFPEVLGLQ